MWNERARSWFVSRILRRQREGAIEPLPSTTSVVPAATAGADELMMPITELESRAAYHESWLWKARDARYLAERALAVAFQDHAAITGMCTCCGSATRFAFRSSPAAAEGEFAMPNWREELACERCGLIMRWRFCFSYLESVLQPGCDARIYITDQASATFMWLRARYPHVVGSEFVRDQATRDRLDAYLVHLTGEPAISVRHEDVTALTLPSDSQDVVMSFEVLEHVPDYRAALREFFRVLRPGGSLLITVPFLHDDPQTKVRALVLPSGEIEHLLEPEYHGDPTSADGCLCFYNFGWDLLDAVREAGFGQVRLLHDWAPAFGFMSFAGALVATK